MSGFGNCMGKMEAKGSWKIYKYGGALLLLAGVAHPHLPYLTAATSGQRYQMPEGRNKRGPPDNFHDASQKSGFDKMICGTQGTESLETWVLRTCRTQISITVWLNFLIPAGISRYGWRRWNDSCTLRKGGCSTRDREIHDVVAFACEDSGEWMPAESGISVRMSRSIMASVSVHVVTNYYRKYGQNIFAPIIGLQRRILT
jgi:hypothetical protein